MYSSISIIGKSRLKQRFSLAENRVKVDFCKTIYAQDFNFNPE